MAFASFHPTQYWWRGFYQNRKYFSMNCRTVARPRQPFRHAGATLKIMIQPTPPTIQLINTPDYRENYANSVQVRVNLWDFLLMFGRVNQTTPENVAIHNFQGIYVSPQQAKALLRVLQQNVTQYETAFGEIKLEPQSPDGVVQ